jgi:hypothetical protein
MSDLSTDRRLDLKVGDWVVVRSREEILRTLDKNGQLEGLPFMPEMFEVCEQQFRVFKRAILAGRSTSYFAIVSYCHLGKANTHPEDATSRTAAQPRKMSAEDGHNISRAQ